MSGRIFILFTILLTRSLQETDKLSEFVKPEKYKIRIRPLIDELKFEGIVEIEVDCEEDTKEVTLHAEKLNFGLDNINVTYVDTSERIHVENMNTEKNHLLRMTLKNHLSKDKKYNIRIEYTGELGQDPHGLHIDHYKDKKGENHSIVVAFFEPTWARQAFPCFDLPHLKATFKISVGRTKQLFSISNMPLAKTEAIKGKEGWVWDHYENTYPMSTYLVAFAVLDEGMKQVSSGKISFWFPPFPKFNAESVLRKANEMLFYLEEYFSMIYELTKLDFLVVNSHPVFSAAIECWGLVILQSSVILEAEESITEIVLHGMVHQWIGNNITMKCFGELWLIEGTTSYLTQNTKNTFSDGQTIDIDIANQFFLVLKNQLSHQLSKSECSDDIEDILDSYVSNTYIKGVLFTRMIELSLGLRNIRKTLDLILKEHKYSNFDENDLWAALKNTTPSENFPEELDIDIALTSWTKQDGFPLVTVSRDYDTGITTVTQQKFSSINEETTQCWWIPLSYTTKSDIYSSTTAKRWMECPKKQIIIGGIKPSDWIIMNLESTGLFIVKYDDDNMKLITKTLSDKKSFEVISFWNRFRLILDAIILTEFGLSTHESLLTTLLYLKYENELVVWEAALKYLSKIDWLENETIQLKNDYMKLLVQPHFYKHLFNSTKPTSKTNKFNKLIIKEACSSGITECVQEYMRIFEDFKASFPDVSSSNTDLLGDVLCFVVRTGPEENKQFLTDILPQTVDNDQLMMQVYNSLINPSCSKTPITPNEQINRKIAAIFINKPPLQRQILGSQGDVFLFDIMSSSLKDVLDKPYSSWAVLDMLSVLADNIHDESERKKLEEFFETNKDKLIRHKKSTDEIMKKISRNEEWKKFNSNDIKDALLKITSTTEPDLPEEIPVALRYDDSSSKLQNELICPVVIFIYFVFLFRIKLILHAL
ncbi:endoplasmic reticulum aminopeptidase 1-like [Harmonia axyridis]|uniref:endoplasmic reticulum aminopeptidase 1-like n=1 Tax=Harmonia axyridis TaxID=115357 RepID=UPI001E276525|nr:endoplasmic reticulum aminopeptidase 1-like [Harmonia axyridis]